MRRVFAILLQLGLLLAIAAGRPTLGEAEALPPDPTQIRVAVVQGQPEITLSIHGRYQVLALENGSVLQDGARLSRAAVRATPEGIFVSGQYLPRAGVQIQPARDATIDLNGQRLRGTVEIRQPTDQALLVINRIGLEEYLRGVLSKEAPHDWPKEALRALAIAARTYALFQRLSKSTIDYDVTGDVLSQVYGGKSAEKWRTTRAVKDTEGLILVYGALVFPTFYHSTCGGLTEQGSVMGPYRLAPLSGGVQCPFCSDSPFYRWRQTLTVGDVAWAMKQRDRGSVWPVSDVRIVETTPTGRAAKIQVTGGGRTIVLTGYEFRQAFGFDRIRSTAFSIVPDGAGGFLLDGRGWGHGVGLCQWGTAALAGRGASAREILAYYYPAAKMVRLGEIPVQAISVDPTQGGS